MKNLSKQKNIALIFIVLTVFTTIFIFSNSLRVGEESSKQSNVIVEIVEPIAEFVGVDLERPSLSHFIRKLGHFTEYFLLGLVSSTAIVFWFERRKYIVFAPIYSLIVAICDEFVFQNITEGRSPQITDVLIDFCGAFCGAAIAIVFLLYLKNRNQRKKQSQKSKK